MTISSICFAGVQQCGDEYIRVYDQNQLLERVWGGVRAKYMQVLHGRGLGFDLDQQ